MEIKEIFNLATWLQIPMTLEKATDIMIETRKLDPDELWDMLLDLRDGEIPAFWY